MPGMKHCDLTLPTPEENLACDEALLERCEAGLEGGLLRFWEPGQYFVVVGYANRVATEVDLAFCKRHTLGVLRRCSGGGTVLQGPGVLNYSLVLRIQEGTPLDGIAATNQFVLERHQAALTALVQAPVELRGYTDLAVGGLKFCGNAQRRKRGALLFHGSFLLHLDLELVEKALPMPSQQPEYRVNRSHSDFLMNLHVPAAVLKGALLRAWGAEESVTEIPIEHISRLVGEKYSLDEWNFKF